MRLTVQSPVVQVHEPASPEDDVHILSVVQVESVDNLIYDPDDSLVCSTIQIVLPLVIVPEQDV